MEYLPYRSRTVTTLVDVGYTGKEIAAKVSPSTFKSLSHRLKQKWSCSTFVVFQFYDRTCPSQAFNVYLMLPS